MKLPFTKTYRLKIDQVKRWIPKRKSRDNKSHGGRTLIWAGSRTMPGAGILACRAAIRVGAGYIFTSTREVLKDFPEALLWNQRSFEKINSVLIGPGLGIQKSLVRNIKRLKKTPLPVVIDADALTVSAQYKLFPFPPHWIAAPHEGELSRLIQKTPNEIRKNRIQAARLAQRTLGCIVVLKGYRTIVAFSNLSVVIPTGNVALAKGGSGDVLGGMIAGLIAQNVEIQKAVLLACYLHGFIADNWIQEGKDYLSLSPSDVIDRIPRALALLRNF